jgi:tripartite-type tricarboxylate transporter receptor subunit TctC
MSYSVLCAVYPSRPLFFLCVLCVHAVCSSAAAAAQQAYPARPIRIIAMSSPGSGPDIVGRLIGSKLTEAWGQQVIVDPRPAATGIVGSEIAAKAAPDGHTLLIVTSQAVIVSVMYEKLTYSLMRDFTPITLVASTPFILAVHPAVPATSIRELVALAKSKPGALRYGSGGSGSPPHLSAEIFKNMTGTDMLHVPYKGITPAMVDTVAGQVQMLISVIPAVLPDQIGAAGRWVSPAQRTTPCLCPATGNGALRVHRLVQPVCPREDAGECRRQTQCRGRGLKTPEPERFTALGAEPRASTPLELAGYLKVQTEKMRKAVQDSGARPD